MGPASEYLAEKVQAGGAAVMGILNVTPDSFYDGGAHVDAVDALRRVDELLAEGADFIDIGGESTRPRAPPVPADEQIARISPALRHAVQHRAWVSVDTTDATVARFALDAGARLINDVSCLSDAALAEVLAEYDAALILMHSRAPMSQMAGFSQYPEDGYDDVVADVRREWRRAKQRALKGGVDPADVWFDPGLGFNKSARQSLTLLARLAEFESEGVPIVVGASRKSFIGSLDNSPPTRRLGGSIAACVTALQQGASVVRVHDVEATRQALRLTLAAQDCVREAMRA